MPGSQVTSAPHQPELDGGRHWRAQLGFILMATDLACEADLFDMAPAGVGIHVTRLNTEAHTSIETLSTHLDGMADAASRLQPELDSDVICYACTSGSIVNGEEAVMAEIRKGAPPSMPMTLVTGVVDALRELDAKRIVVGTPYLDEVNTLEAEFLTSKGFDVLDIQGLNQTTASEFGRVTPAYWQHFALELDRPEADAIFLSCTGTRSLEAVSAIEAAANKPVITSNQAMFWSCLRRAGIEDELEGFGQIFERAGASLAP